MGAQDDRRKRLADALRDNLKRRKAQHRSRRNSAVDQDEKHSPEAAPCPSSSEPAPRQGAQE